MILSCSRINAVSNAQVRGDSYERGCLGRTGKALLSGYCMLVKEGFISRKNKASCESLFRDGNDYVELLVFCF